MTKSSEPFDFEDWVQESRRREQLYHNQLISEGQTPNEDQTQRVPLAFCLALLVFSVLLLLGIVLYYSISAP